MTVFPKDARRLGLAIALFSGCATAPAVPATQGTAVPRVAASALPRTRAERTNFTETSSHADVVAFVDSLRKLGAAISVGSMGKTFEGRDLVYAIASRPLVTSPEEARRLGRPIVFIEGNIHSGEVEGKEALQSVLRELVFDPRPNVLDSVVLIALPDYNADGNERLAPQARSRGEQNGPEMVGTRPNAQGLNLNRDYMKADAPETRASLTMLKAWDPHVFIDLHTTDGSYHGYALTYAPSLNPAAFFGAPFVRDSMAPALRTRMSARGFEIFDYGNYGGGDTTNRVWATYEHTPRFGVNYYPLRGRIAMLSEAFSHDPFERRVRSNEALVHEILSYVATHAASVLALARTADAQATAWGANPASAPPIPIRARLAPPRPGQIRIEDMIRTGDTVRYEPGLTPGLKRSGNFRMVPMGIVDHFDATRTRPMPYGYVIPPGLDSTLALLALHGLAVNRVTAPIRTRVDVFVPDSVVTARPFEGHAMLRLEGKWRTEERMIPAGSTIVPTAQPLSVLAVYLLEPESDDGIAAWNLLTPAPAVGAEFPILRVAQPLPR